jgi:hypothetical protein
MTKTIAGKHQRKQRTAFSQLITFLFPDISAITLRFLTKYAAKS